MRRSFLLLATLTLIAPLVGCSPPAAVPPELPKVGVRQLEKRKLTDQETFNGWLEANKTVEVRSRVRGHIQNVNFTDGEIVHAGEPVKPGEQIRVLPPRKKGEPLKVGHSLFDLDPRPFQTEIDKANEKLKIYQAQHVAAQKEEERLKELLKIGGASKQQTEKAEADVKSLQAQIESSKNEVKRAELDLEYSHIPCEAPGRLSQARLTEGNLVNAGGSDPLLTTIVAIDPIRVYFNVDERSLRRYAKRLMSKQARTEAKTITEALTKIKDMEATFTFALDGETEFTHSGKLLFGDNRIDPTTGTIVLYGEVENKDGEFVPGSRVRVRIPIGKPDDALLVPEMAILADQDKRYVLIVEENPPSGDAKNVVRRKDVTLGTLTDDGMRAITVEDEAEKKSMATWRVIVDNLQRARLDYPVDPQDREPKQKAKPEEKGNKDK
jgi:multidrug efflux system membrane fusion protein